MDFNEISQPALTH